LKTSLAISLSITSAVIIIAAGIIPYFFHDFKLTIVRSDFIINGLKIISQDEKVLDELGISGAIIEADKAFERNKETGRPCFDYYFYSRNLCQSEINVKAFHAYKILQKLPFKDNTLQFFYQSADDQTVAKKYVVYLNSFNWNDYVAFGLIISVTAMMLLALILARFGKSIVRVQNNTARLIAASFLELGLLLKLNSSKSKYTIPISLAGFSIMMVSYTNYMFVLGENFTACYAVFLFFPGLVLFSFGIVATITEKKIALLACVSAIVIIPVILFVIALFTGLSVFPNCGPTYLG